jgi:hypothetical protein
MSSRISLSTRFDERGIALPLALIMLMLLTSLTLALLAVSSTEPMISTNHKTGEQALAAAEAGIERAIWALSNPTVDTAGVNTKLTNLNAIPAAYSGQTLFGLAGLRAYSVTIAGAGPTTITAHGYVVREGVAVPAQPGDLVQANIAAHRQVRLEVTAGGGGAGGGGRVGGAGIDGSLPGALTVAGSVQMSGNSLVDGNDSANGTPNNCAKKGGVTIRDKTTLSGGTEVDNTIGLQGSASAVGTPAQQELGYNDFAAYTFNSAQLQALKALAQASGTYIKPTSNDQFNLNVVDGLMFVDTVNAEALGNPPDASKLANVKITGANNSGWLVVMGSIRIDGNVTYNGFIYAHNDLSYKGTGTGGIYGGVLTGNVIDSVATVVDTDTSGNSRIYFDCSKIANGGGTFTQTVLNGLNRVIIAITPGSWREVSN